MAGSVNKVILVGDLGKYRSPAAQVRRSGGELHGRHLRDLARQDFGERKERTEWHNVVIFNENLGKVAEQY